MQTHSSRLIMAQKNKSLILCYPKILMYERLTTPLACFPVADLSFGIQMMFLKLTLLMVGCSFTLCTWKNEMRNFNLHYHSSVWLCHACSTNIGGDHVLQSRCCKFQLCVVGLCFSYILRKDEERRMLVGGNSALH